MSFKVPATSIVSASAYPTQTITAEQLFSAWVHAAAAAAAAAAACHIDAAGVPCIIDMLGQPGRRQILVQPKARQQRVAVSEWQSTCAR